MGARQRLVPEQEVGCGAEQGAATAAFVVDQHVHPPWASLIVIRQRAVLEDESQIVDIGRGLHPERLEQALAREFGERHLARARDDLGEQHVAAVRIGPFLAGCKIEGALTQNHRHRIVTAVGPVPERDPVAKTAGVRQHVVQRDRVAVIRKLRDVLVDVV